MQGRRPWFDSWVRKIPWRKEKLPAPVFLGFPGGTSGKEPTCQCKKCRRLRFDPWVETITWSRKWQPTPAFLPGESHEQRSLEGYGL